ncbi:hypothetical protein BXZ70DRAFT_1011043 [Cristinia sonorae]|uniref:Uncharacterized protein n=1 Tax=Cristinia sonorae TaxID=1940300 RepID=A0A8K0XLX3_9AGAR|nr:hypothetical protein BXZ70DRAFT_1011043 [Cristinia sonorae]
MYARNVVLAPALAAPALAYPDFIARDHDSLSTTDASGAPSVPEIITMIAKSIGLRAAGDESDPPWD